MIRLVAPGPVILILLETSSSPMVNVIVAGSASAKLMTSLFAAPARGARNVPGPASPAFVTVIVAPVAVTDTQRTNTIAMKAVQEVFRLMGARFYLFPRKKSS